MNKDMQRLINGVWLSLVLGFLLSSCRTSKPPALSIICLGDGVGGADCVDSVGNKIYKKPSELLNYWMTTEVDEQNFASWCYGGGSGGAVKAGMESIKNQVR